MRALNHGQPNLPVPVGAERLADDVLDVAEQLTPIRHEVLHASDGLYLHWSAEFRGLLPAPPGAGRRILSGITREWQWGLSGRVIPPSQRSGVAGNHVGVIVLRELVGDA